MKNTIIPVALGALLLAGGMYWYGKFHSIVSKQATVRHNPQETKQDHNLQSLKTLQDLVNTSEPMTLPVVDTSQWDGYYSNEELGIEFHYPKRDGWKILDASDSVLYKDKVCLGNDTYSNMLIEGESECIVQLDKDAFTRLQEDELVGRIVNQRKLFYNVELPGMQKKFLAFEKNGYSIQLVEEQKLLTFFLLPTARGGSDKIIQSVYYGILQTLKSHPE